MDELKWEKDNDLRWDRYAQSYRFNNCYYCWNTENMLIADFYEREKGKFHYTIHGDFIDTWEYDLEEDSEDVEIVKERIEKLVKQIFSSELESLKKREKFYKEMLDKMN